MNKIILLIILLFPVSILSNMANPYKEGDYSGEPVIVSEMSIDSENLIIDLTPINNGKVPMITAEYTVHNPREAVKTKLFFYAPKILKGNIEINDIKIPSRREKSKIPKWFRYKKESEGLSFYAFLDKGLNKIKAEYSVKPNIYNGKKIFSEYYLEYLFAPSRTWNNFKNLSIEIKKPDGWEVTTEPEIKGMDVKLNSIPSDLFKIKFVNKNALSKVVVWAVPIVTLLGLIFSAALAYKKEKFYELGFFSALLSSLPYLLLSEFLLILMLFLTYNFREFLLGDDIIYISTSWRYNQLFLFIAFLLSGVLFCVLSFYSTIFLKRKFIK